MTKLTKILAIVIIATFLASIPMVLADNKPQLVKVVFELKVDTSDAKPGGNPGGGGSGGGNKGGSGGYSLMGVSWNSLSLPINIEVDKNSAAANSVFFSAVSAGVTEWESHTSKNIVNTVEVSTSSLSVDTIVADGVNEIMFGALSPNNVIAQTTVWYNPSTKSIVDFDMVFNTYYSWGDATVTSSLMDIQNIATHELGHGWGLADLYQAKWSIETMYGYASQGQTNKRTLEAGDISGIQALYGA
jgi:hypothetical protein